MNDRGTILVVDDETESLRVLAGILQQEGYTIRPANSGQLALASIAAQPPDLILLDIRMPGLDGFEVCRRLKAEETTSNIPVIFQSAATDLTDRLEGLRLGAVDYISKPFQREELLARVRTHLELALLRGHLEALVKERTAQLEEEIEKRQKAQAELEKLNNELEQRAILAELSAEIGCDLTASGNLQNMLKQCSESLVRRLNMAFARIWTFNAGENCLELQASAGMYTRIDGSHSVVPSGKFKIGLIAEERKPHITNAVLGDPRVHDQEWAKREGMVAFAGHPLVIGDKLVGVMAMFSRNQLSDLTLKALESVSNEIAIGIERKRNEEALEQLNEELEQRVRQRTAELAAKNTELERLNKIFVGRELRMVELKERVRKLEK